MEYHPNLDGYELIYGALPNTREELLSFLEKELNIDHEALQKREEEINSIGWMEENLTFYVTPKSTPRPRNDGTHFYVKGAADLHRVFKKYLRDRDIICTRVEYYLTVYLPIPMKSMSKEEIYLAEKGVIRPIVLPDWDNVAKTYTDCLQSIILLNDNIINPGYVEKFYSIKPRVEIKLRWMKDFDCEFNKKKTLSSIAYKKLFGKGEGE